jgi:hypothetical protein
MALIGFGIVATLVSIPNSVFPLALDLFGGRRD